MSHSMQAALDLHIYLMDKHWTGEALVGPDPGIRFNYRIGRFVKSYLPGVNWNDDYYYLQGQGYWVMANWALFAHLNDERYRDIAVTCSETILKQQQDDGCWIYPNREWRGRVATAEGTWAAIGLLETYRHTSDRRFLEGTLAWHTYLLDTIGFQQIGDELAINYFANRPSGRVPNNSVAVLRFLAELAEVTANQSYLQPAQGLLRFLARAQQPSGELPYVVPGVEVQDSRPHFQCYQYNAFQCLDLLRYWEITRDSAVLPLITGVLQFLRGGVAQDGHVHYQCGNHYRAVTYHAAVVAAVFQQAARLIDPAYAPLSERAYDYVLSLQRPNGSFVYSRRDYHLLSDRRSYPRYLAMILYHLMHRIAGSVGVEPMQLTTNAAH